MEEHQEQQTRQERRQERKEAQRKAQKAQDRKASSRSALIWGIVVIVIIVILYGVIRLAKPGITTNQPTLLIDEVAVTDNTLGEATAPVTIIEYSDFQCPACRQYYPVVRELEEHFGEHLQVVYRHYPLRSIHPHANLAAQAAEAAGHQGAFWEMHDLLFERQPDWSAGGAQKRTFITYAEELGLDVDQFATDLDSKEVKDIVENGFRSAQQNGLTGTPSFFLNGQRIQNPHGFDAFSALVEAELQSLGVDVSAGGEEELVPDEDES